MTSKNPFEIRAEMIKLAKDYMDQQYHMNIQFLENMVAEGEKARKDIEDQLKDAYKMYSMEDLMTKAQEMYSFVSKKD
jgi:aconitase B